MKTKFKTLNAILLSLVLTSVGISTTQAVVCCGKYKQEGEMVCWNKGDQSKCWPQQQPSSGNIFPCKGTQPIPSPCN